MRLSCDSVGTTLPTVSVLVLNYNGLVHLGPCFDSLRRLEYPADKLELVLVDNNSSDGSVEYMRTQFPAVRIVRHPDNYGFSKGNNLGAGHASGELVAFLNNDMRVDPRWLFELAQPLLREPDVVCSASKILSWDGQRIDYAGSMMNILGYGAQEGWGCHPDAHDQEKYVLAPCGGAMLVDRLVFLDCGGFDEDFFAFYEDSDLGWRLWVLGYRVVYAPRAITFHVHHGWWNQVPNAKVKVLYQRNALSSVVKNYEDRTLRRVLPAALLLFLRRTYLAAQVEPASYRSEPASVAPHLYAEIPHPDAPSQAPVLPTRTGHQVFDSGYYLRETWQTLRRDGLVQLINKMVEEVKRRKEHRRRTRQDFSRRRPRRARSGHVYVAAEAISHLIAADDIVRGLDQLMEKREAIQHRRRLSDQEIFKLFRWPFDADFPGPYYAQTMRDLIASCGLREHFEDGDEAHDATGVDHQ